MGGGEHESVGSRSASNRARSCEPTECIVECVAGGVDTAGSRVDEVLDIAGQHVAGEIGGNSDGTVVRHLVDSGGGVGPEKSIVPAVAYQRHAAAAAVIERIVACPAIQHLVRRASSQRIVSARTENNFASE